jgi:hypothetical protein
MTPTTGVYAMTTPIRVTTTARYHGLQVTIIGELNAGLLAIAGYGTRQELALAAIAVKQRGDQRVYRVAGTSSWTPSLERAAAAAVRLLEATE